MIEHLQVYDTVINAIVLSQIVAITAQFVENASCKCIFHVRQLCSDYGIIDFMVHNFVVPNRKGKTDFHLREVISLLFFMGESNLKMELGSHSRFLVCGSSV